MSSDEAGRKVAERRAEAAALLGLTKSLLLWIVGMLVAAAITIVISFYVADRFLAAHNSPAQGAHSINAR